MTFSFFPEAEKELFSAIAYYEELQEGLGHRFYTEVQQAINEILSFPNAWTALRNSTRRCLVNKFPYGVVYLYNSDEENIEIVAVMNLNREPDYWTERIE